MNRLWLDDKLIVDDPELHDRNPEDCRLLHLQKGQRYPVKIELLRRRLRHQAGLAERHHGSRSPKPSPLPNRPML